MPLYTDVLQMVREIRDHVRETGHEVVTEDYPTKIGYRCPSCSHELAHWHLDIWIFNSIIDGARLYGISLQGILSYDAQRQRLTDYLNGTGEFAFPEPPQVVRVSRYKRTPVI
jgi:hypothetical protein